MAYYPCNIFAGVGDGIADIKLVYSSTSSVVQTFALDAKYEKCILVFSAAASHIDGVESVTAISINTNGNNTQIFEKVYSDSARAFLRTEIYIVTKKSDAINITISGCKTWGVYTIAILA